MYNNIMRLTFKEIRDGMANKIFLNGKFIGLVEVHSWPKIWKIKPVFHYNHKRGAMAAFTKYESCYEAGKALARLHEDTFRRADGEEITDEFDMRGVFKSLGYGP